MARKKTPCPECGAAGYARHDVDCAEGQRRSSNVRRGANSGNKRRVRGNQSVSSIVASGNAADVPLLRNEIALVVDRSSSMFGVGREAVDALNMQIEEIQRQAASTGQETNVSLYFFNTYVDAPLFSSIPAAQVRRIDYSEFRASGMTALLDGVGTAVRDLQRTKGVNDPNTSFLVITITDGGENRSTQFDRGSLRQLMQSVVRTDRWSFVFNCPAGHERYFNRLGIPAGNVRPWENDSVGTSEMQSAVSAGLGSYYTARSAGQTKTTEFFQVDMSQVSSTAIENLTDLSSNFQTWKVGAEADIRAFVDGKLASNARLRARLGSSYQAGRAYYQLTKPEKVQPGKDLIIRDMSTGLLYGGDQARGLIGMPTNVDVRVKPGNHGNYDIFVLSTSWNRKLVRGTDLLYRR